MFDEKAAEAGAATNQPADTPSANELFLSADQPNRPQAGPVDPEVEIQGMPKEFRDYHPIAGGHGRGTGLLIMVVSFLFLIAVSAGVYWYIFKPYLEEQDKTAQNNQQLAALENVQQPGENEANLPTEITETPTQVYQKYIAALGQTVDFNGYFQIISQYGTQYKISQAEAEKLRFGSNATAVEQTEFLTGQLPELTGQETVSEQINNDQATLTIMGPDQAIVGVVDLLQENGQWRINNVAWQDWQTVETNQPESQYTKAEDRDNDGLADVEEELLGSNKNSADSDNDGYSDSSEVANLYNPAGNDKLIDSPTVSSYLNEIFDYSIIYPSKWSKEVRDNRESVIFRAPDNSLIQVVAMLNPGKKSIDNWYKENFNVSAIDSQLVVTNSNWQGIKTPDGLYIYIQGFDSSEIFIIDYVPRGTTLDYPNLFAAMVNSFVIK